MTTNELRQELNSLDGETKFSVKEFKEGKASFYPGQNSETEVAFVRADKGEVWIYTNQGGLRKLMAKILPPTNLVIPWKVYLKSQVPYDHERLSVYIDALAIIDRFLTDKEKKQ